MHPIPETEMEATVVMELAAQIVEEIIKSQQTQRQMHRELL
jgi:hypothetical protein